MSLLTCGAGGALDASPPTNTVLPAITGTAQQGQVLTCSTGSWTGSPTSYTYQWTNSSTGNISGATSSTYTAQSSDVGDTLTCTVTAHNTSGATPATSAATSTVLPPAPAFSSAAVSANGTTFTITFTQAITSGSSGLTFKDGSNTYTLTYVSGIGTATLTYTIGTTVYSGDTCTIAYTAGNIAGSGGSVANFTAQSVTNNSTQSPPPTLVSATIASNGTTLTTVWSASVTGTGADGLTVVCAAGSVTGTYVSGSGTTTLVHTLNQTVLSGDATPPSLTYSGTGLTPSPTAFTGGTVTNNSTHGSFSAPSLVSHVATAAQTTGTFNSTGANLITTVSAADPTVGNVTITDNFLNIYQNVPTTGYYVTIAYVVNPIVGSAHTCTIGGTGNIKPIVSVMTWANMSASGLDKYADTQTDAPGSITPTKSNEVLVSGCQQQVAGSPGSPSAVDSSFNLLDSANYSTGIGFSNAYLIETTATTKNITWTVGHPTCGSAIASFFSLTSATPGVRSTTAPVGSGSGAPSTLNIAYPSGGNAPQAGDAIIVFLGQSAGNNTAPTTPSGYTLVKHTLYSFYYEITCFQKIASGSESGNLTLSFSSGDAVAWMVVCDNVLTGYVGTPQAADGAASSIGIPSQTPPGTAVLLSFAIACDGSSSAQTPSAMGAPAILTTTTSLVKTTNQGMGAMGGYAAVNAATGIMTWTETGLSSPEMVGMSVLVQ